MTALRLSQTLVGWCSDHEAYTNPPEKECPGWEPYERCHYRKRLMYLCPLPNHCDDLAFFERAHLEAHMRGEDDGWAR